MHEKTCVTKDYSISESIGEKEELECLNCNKNFTTNKKLENHKKKCKSQANIYQKLKPQYLKTK